MERLVLCTTNPGKVKELRTLLAHIMPVQTLVEAGLEGGWDESGGTFAENALLKARSAFRECGSPCLADDSGLEVDALGGAPGVRSARYAGLGASDQENVELLLRNMAGRVHRNARFVTVLAYVDQTTEYTFTGEVRGSIAQRSAGSNGFGYDPVFIPEGQELTFGQLDSLEKNQLSHRQKAIQGFLRFIRSKK
jgi:XTP/dITP diphosphohydrolase